MFYVQIVALGMRKNKNGIVRVAHLLTKNRPPTRPPTPPYYQCFAPPRVLLLSLPPKMQTPPKIQPPKTQHQQR
jgi:hypothetical protein